MKTKLKDNKIFRLIIIPISLILCFVGQFIPAVNGFSSEAFGVLFIFLGVLILWLTIGIDWPSLLCIFALGFIPSFGFTKVFTTSFGNSTFIFLLFTFICTYALSKTSFIKRVAISFVNFKLARKNGYLFIFFFLLASLILGLFISPSVLFLVLLPILNEILDISNIDVSTFEYIGLAFPTGLILFLLMYFALILFIKPDIKKIKFDNLTKLKDELPKINKKEIITLIIFITILLLWILPSLFEYIYEPIYLFFNKYGTAMPPILGVLALCIIRIDNEPIIKIDDAFKNGVPWGSLIMCAATLCLGEAIKSDSIGIIPYLENNLGPLLISLPGIVLLIVFIIWAIIQTNLSSNMVTATLVATVASTILLSTSTSINLNALICIIGMLSSFAFATPPAMPHIAIISSSESCSTKDVFIYGT